MRTFAGKIITWLLLLRPTTPWPQHLRMQVKQLLRLSHSSYWARESKGQLKTRRTEGEAFKKKRKVGKTQSLRLQKRKKISSRRRKFLSFSLYGASALPKTPSEWPPWKCSQIRSGETIPLVSFATCLGAPFFAHFWLGNVLIIN